LARYKSGEKITNISTFIDQEFIFCDGKLYHKGWAMSWSVRLVISCINRGSVRFAVKAEQEDKKC
jgi:hypothetical protein